MRRSFAAFLESQMEKDENIYTLVGDLGYGMFDKIKDKYPKRYFNTGAAEQALLGIGIGLALDGKIPVLYTATPFLIYRPFELIRNYLNIEKIPVKLVGSGRGKDYGNLGMTHWADDVEKVLEALPNVKTYFPKKENNLFDIFSDFVYNKEPSFLSLIR
jgi:transketolase